jgi:hypothetical protein
MGNAINKELSRLWHTTGKGLPRASVDFVLFMGYRFLVINSVNTHIIGLQNIKIYRLMPDKGEFLWKSPVFSFRRIKCPLVIYKAKKQAKCGGVATGTPLHLVYFTPLFRVCFVFICLIVFSFL